MLSQKMGSYDNSTDYNNGYYDGYEACRFDHKDENADAEKILVLFTMFIFGITFGVFATFVPRIIRTCLFKQRIADSSNNENLRNDALAQSFPPKYEKNAS